MFSCSVLCFLQASLIPFGNEAGCDEEGVLLLCLMWLILPIIILGSGSTVGGSEEEIRKGNKAAGRREISSKCAASKFSARGNPLPTQKTLAFRDVVLAPGSFWLRCEEPPFLTAQEQRRGCSTRQEAAWDINSATSNREPDL